MKVARRRKSLIWIKLKAADKCHAQQDDADFSSRVETWIIIIQETLNLWRFTNCYTSFELLPSSRSFVLCFLLIIQQMAKEFCDACCSLLRRKLFHLANVILMIYWVWRIKNCVLQQQQPTLSATRNMEINFQMHF